LQQEKQKHKMHDTAVHHHRWQAVTTSVLCALAALPKECAGSGSLQDTLAVPVQTGSTCLLITVTYSCLEHAHDMSNETDHLPDGTSRALSTPYAFAAAG
jgi:hypothetical protein